jgi:hypothetical protein
VAWNISSLSCHCHFLKHLVQVALVRRNTGSTKLSA